MFSQRRQEALAEVAEFLTGKAQERPDAANEGSKGSGGGVKVNGEATAP